MTNSEIYAVDKVSIESIGMKYLVFDHENISRDLLRFILKNNTPTSNVYLENV